MGFKVGGATPAPAVEPEIVEGHDDSDGEDPTAGEDLYGVLLAALSQATDAEQFQIAAALSAKTAWAELSQELRDLFDAAGDAFEELGADE